MHLIILAMLICLISDWVERRDPWPKDEQQ